MGTPAKGDEHIPEVSIPDWDETQSIDALHQRLLELQGELEGMETLSTVGCTVAGLAHTIRSTLGLSRGAAYLLDRALHRQDRHALGRAWKMVRRWLVHMEALAGGLLDPERAGQPILEPGNPDEELRELAEMIVEEGAHRGVAVILSLDANLEHVVFDHSALRRCIVELSANALAVLEGTAMPRRLVIKTTRERAGWSLVIRDTGPGMSRHRLEEVRNATAAGAAHRGSGLGLVLVRQLMALHQGALEITSELGAGTTIRCWFPVDLEPSAPLEPNRPQLDEKNVRSEKMNQNALTSSVLPREDFTHRVKELIPHGGNLDLCIGCGTCASRCPASGLSGMDPRKFVHLLLMGRYEEAIRSPWVWMCSLCKRCQWACPMDIDIPQLVYLARATWPREERPKGIVGSCDQALSSDCCSAMGLPVDDWTWVIEDVLEEVHDEQPDWQDLQAPMDKEGAEFLLNENSRAPGHEPEEMVPIWKILHRVGADWTYPSKGWGGENYCMFLADDPGWQKISQVKAKAADDLGCKVWLNTECGHEFYAVWAGMKRFGVDRNFEIHHIIEYYAKWIREGKLEVSSDWNRELGVKFTVQDPCQVVRKSLGREAAEDLRYVVEKCVGKEHFIDMVPNRENNYCCGGGGGYLQSGYNDARFHYGTRKFRQIQETGAAYCITPCHNCHQQIEELAEHFGGDYKTVHLWTIICLAIGALGPNERKYLGEDLARVGLPQEGQVSP